MPPDTTRLLASTALRLLVCSAFTYGLWHGLGWIGVVVSAPLFGVLLARPLLDWASEVRRIGRTRAYHDVQGHHYAHRGVRVRVVEDLHHQRWLRVDDVRKLAPGLPRAVLLKRLYPDDVRTEAAPLGEVMRADALLQHLAQSTQAESLRLRHWIERDIARPAARVRARLGIREPLASAPRESMP